MKVVRYLFLSLGALSLAACFQNTEVDSSASSALLPAPTFSSHSSGIVNIASSVDSFILSGNCPMFSSGIEFTTDGGATWVTPSGGSTDVSCSGSTFSIDFPSVVGSWSAMGFSSYIYPEKKDFFVRGVTSYGPSASAKFTVRVPAVDTPPVANAMTPASFNEDMQSVITLSYTDADGDLATLCTVSGLSNVSVTQGCACSAGTCTVGVTGALNYYGSASFNFTVDANAQTSNTATATLTIDSVDDAPVLAAIGNQIVSENSAITQINASDTNTGLDTDIDGESISYNCWYDMTVDGSVAAATLCSSLAGVSFTAATGVLDWAPNDIQSGIYEFKIKGTAGALSDSKIFTITVNDVAQVWNFASATSNPLESDGTHNIVINLSVAPNTNKTIAYTVSDGTALTAGTPSDYTFASGTATILAGQMSTTISASINDDTYDEDDETFSVTLSSPAAGTTLGSTFTHAVTIQDNDDPPEINFFNASSNSLESAGAQNMVVTLNHASETAITVDYAVADITAENLGTPVDYTMSSGTLTFASGELSKTITASINDDTYDEDDETFSVTLSNNLPAPNSSIGATNIHTFTIQDNDNAPIINFAAASASALESVLTRNIIVNLDHESENPVTVVYTVDDLTAETGGTPSDYTMSSGTLTFAAGELSKNLTATINDDNYDEPATEDFKVTLIVPTNATLGVTDVHTEIIQDNDTAPVINFASATGATDEDSGSASIVINLSNPSYQNVTVDYTVTDGTALSSNSDYTFANGTATFLPGSTVVTLAPQIDDDVLSEGDEDFTITLVTPTNGTLGGTTIHTHTITDDEAALQQFTWTNGAANGLWSDASNWQGGVPGPGDTAYFTEDCSGCTVSINMVVTVGSIEMSGAFNGTITQWNSYNVTIQNDLMISAGTFNSAGSPTSLSVGRDLTITAGMLNLGYSLFISRNLTISGGALNHGNQKVILNGTEDATLNLNGAPLYDLEIAKTDPTSIIVTGSLVVQHDLRLNSPTGVLTGAGSLNVRGDIYVDAFNGGAGTIMVDGSASQSITGTSGAKLPNLNINKSGGTLNLYGDIGAANDWIYTSGSVNAGTSTVKFLSSLSSSISSGGMVFNDVIFNKSTSGNISILNPMVVNGDLTINNATGGINSSSISVAGDIDLQSGGGGSTELILNGGSDQNISESGGAWPTGKITVNKTGGSRVVQQSGITLDGSGQDLQIVNGIWDMNAGDLVLDDTIDLGSGTELFKNCHSLSYGSTSGSGLIRDGTYGVALSVNDPLDVIENNPQIFSITTPVQNCENITFNYSTVQGTAQSGVDYVANSGVATLLSGLTIANITVTTSYDTLDEDNENYTLQISNPSGNPVVLDAVGQGVILDDDGMPNIYVADSSANEGQNLQFIVTLDAPSGRDITFQYSTANGSASSPSDFSAFASADATILAGNTAFTISVSTDADGVYDSIGTFEGFTLSLGALVNVGIGDITANGLIYETGTELGGLGAPGVTDNSFTVTIPFLGDANGDALATLYYCNDSQSASCDPESGPGQNSVAMTPVGGNFTQTVSGLGSFAGHTFNIRVVVNDADGTNNSPVNSSATLSTNPLNEITLSGPIYFSDIEWTQFTASVDFTNDLNTSATVTLYYCNATDAPSCDPELGATVPMSRMTTTYEATVVGLGAPNDPHDRLNIRIKATDFDPVSGGPVDGYVDLDMLKTRLMPITFENQTENTFRVIAPIEGDDNKSATATLWYCEQNNYGASCNPESYSSVPMVHMGNKFTGFATDPIFATLEASENVNVRVVVSDVDGVMGSPQNNIAHLSPQRVSPVGGAVKSMGELSGNRRVLGGNFTGLDSKLNRGVALINLDGSEVQDFDSGTNGGSVAAISQTPTGDVILGGIITSNKNIMRMNSSGFIDTSFSDSLSGFNNNVNAIARQADGNFIIGGNFTNYKGTAVNRLVRILPDGNIDTSFSIGSGPDGPISAIAIQQDGRIILTGSFSWYDGTSRSRIVRINSNGSLDGAFNPGTGADGVISAIAIQQDGRILIGGSFTNYNGSGVGKIARLESDGTQNSAFTTGVGFDGLVNAIELQPNNQILVGGTFSNYNSTGVSKLVRLNSDGTHDSAYTPGADSTVNSIKYIPNRNSVVVGGAFTIIGGANCANLCVLDLNGVKSPSFNSSMGFKEPVSVVHYDSDNQQIIAGGSFTHYNAISQNSLAVIGSDGRRDPAFKMSQGFGTSASMVNAISIMPGDKILVGGSFTEYRGTPLNHIVRINDDGTIDSSFNSGTGLNNMINAMAIDSTNKIVIGGNFTTYDGTGRIRIARINSDGSVDGSFNPSSGANNTISVLAIDSNDKIVVGGNFTNYNGTGRNRIARINSGGALDNTFNPGTGIGANNTILALDIQSDNSVIIGGSFTTYNGVGVSKLARIDTSGNLDGTFKSNIGTSVSGLSATIYSINILSDNSIFIGGAFTHFNSNNQNSIVKLTPSGNIDGGFTMGSSGVLDGEVRSLLNDGSSGLIGVGGVFFTNYLAFPASGYVQP